MSTTGTMGFLCSFLWTPTYEHVCQPGSEFDGALRLWRRDVKIPGLIIGMVERSATLIVDSDVMQPTTHSGRGSCS